MFKIDKDYFYQSIVEHTSVGYLYSKVLYDHMGEPVDYQFVEMNKAYELMMGIQEKEWIGKKMSELYDLIQKDPESWNAFHDRLFAQYTEKELEMHFKYLDKHYRIKIHSPKKDYIITSLTDISVEIGETEKLQTLFDNVPLQVWFLKDSTTYLSANKAHADFRGFTRDELVKKDFTEILGSEKAATCLLGNERVFREKRQIISEEWLENSQGEERLLRVTKNPKLNPKGEISFVICSAEDITEDYLNKQQKEIQEKILVSSMDFTEELLTNKNLDEALLNGIEMLGNATKTDRVYYWENHYDESSDRWLTSRKIEWCLDETQKEMAESQFQNIPFDDIDFFINDLSQKKSFSYQISDLDKNETQARDYLESRGILSVLSIPIFINDDFIGFIGFDSCQSEKTWSQVEISLLNSFVLLYAKALERTYLEKEVKQANDNFYNFFNMIQDLLIVLDYEGTIIDMNNNVLKRLNYTREELIGASYLKFHPVDEQDEIQYHFKELTTKESKYCKLNAITKEGDIFPIETINTKGIWNDQPVIFSVGKDVSELALSEDKFSKAFNNSGVSMFISRFEDSKILEVNNTFLDFFGYTKDEIIGKNTLDLQKTIDYEESKLFKEQIVIDQKISDLEIKFVNKNNVVRIGLTNIVPVTINNEKCLLTSIIDISDRVQSEKEILDLSNRDSLTNLYNRRFVYEALEEIIEKSKRNQDVFSVAIIDIDNFKSINDNYGHQFGDDILVKFSKIIKNSLRSHDILGRYGGEEFIVVINHADLTRSYQVLKRVLGSIRDKLFFLDEEQIELTFSAGIISSDELTKEDRSIDRLVERADQRMYRAKKEGKNKIVSKE